MNRFQIHRGHMTRSTANQLCISRKSGQPLAQPVGSLRGWAAYVCDGKAWLFNGERVLTCDWFEFCDFIRKYASNKGPNND